MSVSTPGEPGSAGEPGSPGGFPAELLSLSPDSAINRLMIEHDWSTSALGPPKRWPRTLRTAVSVCMNSRFPMLIWWGRELAMLYNDAYVPVLGDKHPAALGQPGAQAAGYGLAGAASVPPKLPAGTAWQWIWRAASCGEVVTATGPADQLPDSLRVGPGPIGDADVDTAVALPLTVDGQHQPVGVLVTGGQSAPSTRRRLPGVS